MADGFGDTRPIANPRIRIKNHRIEFVIIDPAQ